MVSEEVVVGVVPMKGISFLLGNDVARGRVKVSPIVPKSPMCEENQSRDDECHKVGHSENSKVRDNPNLLPSRLSESKRSCGVNEGQGKVELDEAKGERGKAARTSGRHKVRAKAILFREMPKSVCCGNCRLPVPLDQERA